MPASGSAVSGSWVRELRTQLGLTQSQLADRLGVTYVTISRWETGQARPSRLAQKALLALANAAPAPAPDTLPPAVREAGAPYLAPAGAAITDFRADPETVRLFVESERLRYGHLFNPVFGTETALIDPLPHQIIAVYNQMLPQPRLRFLLADDAGAGKTIMAGLYMREMLSRGLIRRVLVVPPAGLVGNWKRELRLLFSLHLREVTGADCRAENPFAGPGSDLAIVSVDSLATGRAFQRLAEPETTPYDLVIFDEAHKLSAFRNVDLTYETTDRYKLAELLAGAEPLQDSRPPRRLPWHAHHLLLLTATPHMGRDFPYYALWRLLEPSLLRTADAFNRFPPDARARHFLRRTKEEMVRFDRSRIYPTRVSETAGYELSPLEDELYERVTSYVRTHYNRARMLNRSAARLAMSILQRRAASSTWALLCSLRRRRERIEEYIGKLLAQELTEQRFRAQQAQLRLRNLEDEKTSDEEEPRDEREERDVEDDLAMGATTAANLADLQVERVVVEELLELAQRVYDRGEEAKLERLREVIQDPRFRDEKLLIFTEHRDTMDFLVRRLEGMGYTGQVARIHGGMPYPEREAQMDEFRGPCRFMVATDAAGEGINLQFCWIMVDYDIPWNPARIEQRFGRIHRYKQAHDPVVLLNLVANGTREGKVLKVLLEKLEAIRKELKSDKVFDVIGRQLQGISLSEIIMRAVTEDRGEAEAAYVDGLLTLQQVRAIEEADARLRATGGDVVSQLPALLARRDRDHLQRLLPGYVRRFIEQTAPRIGIAITGDLEGRFQLERLPLGLALALEEATDGGAVALTVHKPEIGDAVLFLRPGEPFFDRYRSYFCELVADAARRGATFADPYATEPYLYHLAMLTVVRRADPAFPDAFASERVLEARLVAVSQPLSAEPLPSITRAGEPAASIPTPAPTKNPSAPAGRPESTAQPQPCPVELLMLLRPLTHVPPAAWPSHDQIAAVLQRAGAFVEQAVAQPLARQWQERLAASVDDRETFLKAGFDYHEAELMELRSRLREQVEAGDAAARHRLEEVRERQRALRARQERALAVLRREPELVEAGGVTFLAHALVLPSAEPADRERHDREVERVAMAVARSYEEAHVAAVRDVSLPDLAWQAGLDRAPGFDLLSERPDGERRCIEVKGRRGVGDVELTENEWTRAANLRRQYWLYVVYDCAAAHPRLLRVQDPFVRLLFKAKGGVVIDEASIFQAAEDAPPDQSRDRQGAVLP